MVDNTNILATRYASAELAELWSARTKVIMERKFWIAVMRAQAKQGVDISDDVIKAYENVAEDVDLESIAKREDITRHDVKARIDEFCELAGHQQIHRAMTSRDLTENVEQVQVRQSLEIVRTGLMGVMAQLVALATEHANLPMTARTHNVPAQVTTLGKRFADATEEILLGYERLDELIKRYPLRGVKGPVGTQADLLELLGSPEAVAEFDSEIASHCGFEQVLDSVGQVYPRSLDLDVVSALVQAVSGLTSLATTLRLMAGQGLVSEGRSEGQVGSSAMPHKVNAALAERIGALRIVLDGHLTMAASLAGRQWNEGDVSCSAVRRVMLPDAFFATDGLVRTASKMLDSLVVNETAIEQELRDELPLLMTTRIMASLIESGTGREEAHEIVSEHVHALSEGEQLAERIANDPRVSVTQNYLSSLVEVADDLVVKQIAVVTARVKKI